MLGGGGGVSHPSQLTTGLVIKSVTTSPTLAGERMLFILQVSILSEQIWVYKGVCNRGHKFGPCFINIGHKNQNRLNNKNTISIWI